MLRALHERSVETAGELERLIHPEAEMRLLMTFGRLVRGRDQVLEALFRGRQATIYHARVKAFEWLDEQVVLTSANARYALEQGGFAAGSVWWLDEFRDGLIWRVTVFKTEEMARRGYADGLRNGHRMLPVWPSE